MAMAMAAMDAGAEGYGLPLVLGEEGDFFGSPAPSRPICFGGSGDASKFLIAGGQEWN